MTQLQCSNGHSFREASRKHVRETVEDVVYVKQKVKHFNREGSEYWKEMEMPDFVEREVEVDLVEYVCDTCHERRVVRENEVKSAAGARDNTAS